MKKIKTRFAPSPTGALHIGGLRTALFSYLFAKKNGGEFLLRIEDTDSKRFVPGAEEYIKASLEWVGLSYDGEVLKQSERKEIYRIFADQLIKNGKAYYAFDTEEELEAKRAEFTAAGIASPQYNYIMRDKMKNSLTLSSEEVIKKLDAGEPYVIRIKMPRKEEIRFQDKIKGWMVVNTDSLDDKVIWKSADGLPTYHLANVVDDYSSGITHVIRGSEWLSSTPLHIILYKSLGWENDIPEFVHLPLLTHKGKKLSKRNADEYKVPVFPMPWEDYDNFATRQFSPEATINFIALLGWNPGTEQEIFTMEELIQSFSLERIGNASGSEVDMEKASWINARHLRKLPVEKLFGLCYTDKLLLDFTPRYCHKAIELIRDRIVFPVDIVFESKFFFVAPKPEFYDPEVIKKHWTADKKIVLEAIKEGLANDTEFSVDSTHKITQDILEKSDNAKSKNIFPLLRLFMVGNNVGPPMFEIISLLGKNEVIKRIDAGIEYLTSNN